MHKLITLLFHDVYAGSPGESGFAGPGADRYKLPLAAFKAQIEAVTRVRGDLPVLVTDAPRAQGTKLPFALSVDDGGLSYHSVIAPCLADYGWRGHCMVTTGRLGHPGFLHGHHLRDIHAAGHLIGTHSVTHPPRFDTCSWEQLVAEWSRSKEALENVIGERVIAGSIPGGYYSRRVAEAARAAGLEILMSSEPETSIHDVAGCRVFGRFTLRRDSPPDLAARLVQAGQAARAQQWLAWNAKKVLKKSLGAGYMQLTSRLVH